MQQIQNANVGGQSARKGFLVSGSKVEVDKLMLDLNNFVNNPQNFTETIEVSDMSSISDNLLMKITQLMNKKYQTYGKQPGQILEIKRQHNKVRIIGFAAYNARTEVKEILDKAS